MQPDGKATKGPESRSASDPVKLIIGGDLQGEPIICFTGPAGPLACHEKGSLVRIRICQRDNMNESDR